MTTILSRGRWVNQVSRIFTETKSGHSGVYVCLVTDAMRWYSADFKVGYVSVKFLWLSGDLEYNLAEQATQRLITMTSHERHDVSN